MNDKIKELILAAKDAFRYLDHDNCSYGNNGPDGDYCTCRVQAFARRLEKAIKECE